MKLTKLVGPEPVKTEIDIEPSQIAYVRPSAASSFLRLIDGSEIEVLQTPEEIAKGHRFVKMLPESTSEFDLEFWINMHVGA
jgi:hypothetical protein